MRLSAQVSVLLAAWCVALPAQAAPDFKLTDIKISPSSPTVGSNVTITATTQNQGSTAWKSIEVRYYLDGSWCASDSITFPFFGGNFNDESTSAAACQPKTSGNHTIKVWADASGKYNEASESNNTRSETYYWKPQPKPDLVVTGISLSPSSPAVGSGKLTATIKNQGAASTGCKNIDINMYINGSKCDSGIVICGLGAGSSTSEDTTKCNPSSSGTYKIKYTVDVNSEVSESNENNNSYEKSFTWYYPDLVVSSVSSSPSSPYVDEKASFTATLKNQGKVTSSGFSIAYYLDGKQCDTDSVGSLSAGKSTTESTSASACQASSSGNHTLKVTADYNSNIKEQSEGNNSTSKTIKWKPKKLPDLVVSSITASVGTPKVGDSVKFTATLKNQGSAGTGVVSIPVDFYLDGNKCATESLSLGLGEGSSNNESTSASACQPKTAGKHTIKVVIDGGGKVKESNENNNEKSFSHTWHQADLIVTNISISPGQPKAGEGKITATIKNQGQVSTGCVNIDIDMYLDGSKCDSGIVICGLGAGSSTTEETTSCNAKTAGAHTVKFVVDTQGDVAESNESNNTLSKQFTWHQADLIVTDISISPGQPKVGEGKITATIKNQGVVSTGCVNIDIGMKLDGVSCDSGLVLCGLGAGKTTTEQTTACNPKTGGDHTIEFTVDTKNDVAESNENNNSKTVTFEWVEPDLVVSAIAVQPSQPKVGEGTITATIKNQGKVATDLLVAINVDMYLDGVKCDSGVIVGGLGAGGTASEQTSKCNPSTPGPHKIKYVVDTKGDVAEADETNNTLEVTLNWHLSDLVVQKIELSPANPKAGDSGTLTATIANVGPVNTGCTNIDVDMYLDDVKCDSGVILCGLGAGKTTTEQTKKCVPTTDGPHTVRFEVDPGNEVLETDEKNNSKSQVFNWYLPDLIVTDITMDKENPKAGDPVTFTATLANEGKVDTACKVINLSFYLDDAEEPCDTGVILCGLGADEDTTDKTSKCVPATAGTHTLRVVVDTKEDVIEADEENNELAVDFFFCGDELCDGLDNDCNGVVDDPWPGLGAACDGLDSDLCANGVVICGSDLASTTCGPEGVTDITELCDELDNDCDGEVDEDFAEQLAQVCDGDDSDACENGVYICSEDGKSVFCEETTTDIPELCNGVDDDCDEQVDNGFEGLGEPCDSEDADLCQNGVFSCSDDQTTLLCLESQTDIVDLCNGMDDDCDGEVDEDFTMLGQPCDTADSDQCANGVFTCTADGFALECAFESETDLVEVCDGEDNDCNGETDEQWPELGDACDGDDDDQCANGQLACAESGDEVVCADDLAAVELCDGEDNDCDGEVDEDFLDQLGAPCDGADSDACMNGAYTCGDDGALACVNETVTDIAEACNGLDDDCDGELDEDFALLGTACDGDDPDECKAGTFACSADQVSLECVGDVVSDEICDGADNNCDGVIDEGWPLLGAACDGPDGDLCEGGTFTCSADGATVECVNDDGAPPELCDGVDNDCDSEIDEGFDGLGDTCEAQVGGCTLSGVVACSEDGQSAQCLAEPDPDWTELCNGLDDDCDGSVDEVFSQLGTPCAGGSGACVTTGSWVCDGAQQGLECDAEDVVPAAAEVCDHGIDDDCNGTIDEGCECVAGEFISCGSSVGACQAGLQHCQADGTFGAACLGQVLPTEEVCDDLDNDCDAAVDEGCACEEGAVRSCVENAGACSAGQQTCADAVWGPCEGEKLYAPEVCDDAVDNDCDGVVDNGCGCVDGAVRECPVIPDECADYVQVCELGSWAPCSAQPGTETPDCVPDENISTGGPSLTGGDAGTGNPPQPQIVKGGESGCAAGPSSSGALWPTVALLMLGLAATRRSRRRPGPGRTCRSRPASAS